MAYMHKGQGKGGKSVFSPPPPKVWKFFPPCLEVFPPLLFSPLFQFFDHFSLYYPPFWNIEKSFPPLRRRQPKFFRNFFKIFPFFQIFSQKFNFPKASPPKKVKKIFPKEKFSPPIYSFEVIFLPPFMISSGGFFLPPEKFQ